MTLPEPPERLSAQSTRGKAEDDASPDRASTSESLCSKCKSEPRVKGQRWGKRCKAAYMRDVYRPTVAATRISQAKPLPITEGMRLEKTICEACRVGGRTESKRSCADCHSAYAAEWRRAHPIRTANQRKKENARSYANVYKRRGHLQPRPCEACGSDQVEMHHDNYDLPLEVRWLCRDCHMAHHQD